MSRIVRTLAPFDALTEMRQVMDAFDRALFTPNNGGAAMPAANTGLTLPLEILEKEGKVLIRAAVPGVAPEDLDVSVEDGVLTIRGELKREFEDKDVRVYRREYTYGTFSRSLRLPEDLDLDQIDAEFKNGFVTITLPRVEQPKPEIRRVEVRAS